MARRQERNLSLKIFHIIFIVASIILSFGFGAWAWQYHQINKEPLYLGFSLVSYIFGILLVLYLTKVIKKLKKIN